MTKFSKKQEVSYRGQKYLPHLAKLEELGTIRDVKFAQKVTIIMSRNFFVHEAFL